MFTVENQVAPMRVHTDAFPQFRAWCATTRRLPEPQALRFQFVNEAEGADWVVLRDIERNFEQVVFGEGGKIQLSLLA